MAYRPELRPPKGMAVWISDSGQGSAEEEGLEGEEACAASDWTFGGFGSVFEDVHSSCDAHAKGGG